MRIDRENRLLASKNNNAIELIEEEHQKHNPLSNWKKNFHNNEFKLIASIPFVRNLAEYCGYEDEHQKLTSFLHVKENTDNLTINELEGLFKSVLKDQANLTLGYPDRKVIALIFELAGRIGSDTNALENKIVLSIAIRLKAEYFMINKIDDMVFVDNITTNQTIELISRFKKDFHREKESRSVLEEVNLMTPENIHLNSFMYEPILDMSAYHLKKLYKDVTDVLL